MLVVKKSAIYRSMNTCTAARRSLRGKHSVAQKCLCNAITRIRRVSKSSTSTSIAAQKRNISPNLLTGMNDLSPIGSPSSLIQMSPNSSDSFPLIEDREGIPIESILEISSKMTIIKFQSQSEVDLLFQSRITLNSEILKLKVSTMVVGHSSSEIENSREIQSLMTETDIMEIMGAETREEYEASLEGHRKQAMGIIRNQIGKLINRSLITRE